MNSRHAADNYRIPAHHYTTFSVSLSSSLVSSYLRLTCIGSCTRVEKLKIRLQRPHFYITVRILFWLHNIYALDDLAAHTNVLQNYCAEFKVCTITNHKHLIAELLLLLNRTIIAPPPLSFIHYARFLTTHLMIPHVLYVITPHRFLTSFWS